MAEVRDIIKFRGKRGETITGVVVLKRWVHGRTRASHFILHVAQMSTNGGIETGIFWNVSERGVMRSMEERRANDVLWTAANAAVQAVQERKIENHEAQREGGLHLVQLLDVRIRDQIKIRGTHGNNWSAMVVSVDALGGRVGISRYGTWEERERAMSRPAVFRERQTDCRWIPAQAILTNLSQVIRERDLAARVVDPQRSANG
jgi:hypothetical protein